jgi:AhpD family alkylhydroperoxidase
MTERISLKKVSPEGNMAFAPLTQYIRASSLGRELVDLVFQRVSQINGCAYCVDLHWRDAMKAGDDARKFFSPRERAALAWAESLTNVAETGAPDADYDLAKSQFSDHELGDLTIVIAYMNALNRLGVGLRMQPPASV